MEQKDRDTIQENFSSLVDQTDLDLMVTALYEKGVFSDLMIEPYKDTNKDMRTRKRQLYRDITRRGPEAFRHLLDALQENGYWSLVRTLHPSSIPLYEDRPAFPPTPVKGEMISLYDKNKKRNGKESNDLNENEHGPSISPTSRESQTKPETPEEQEVNGNEEASPLEGNASGETERLFPHVVKSTKFFEDDGSDIKLYRTRGRFRGVLLLFCYNSFQFDVEEAREGARVDVDNLRHLFHELGFKIITYINLTYKETKQTLEILKDGICGEGPETVFVVFSSHGYARLGTGDTDIRCYDGHLISYYEIIEYFNNEKFPALTGIPKVFIFQICRGSNKDYGNTPPRYIKPPQHLVQPGGGGGGGRGGGGDARTATDGRVYGSEDHERRPHDDELDRTYSDILIAHSTIPGYVSNRDKVQGSWYIQALCEVFATSAHRYHVDKLFSLVDLTLKKRFSTQTSSVDRWGFNRRLYLHPGLVEPDAD